MSQSSMPASARTVGCAALPTTVRTSRRSWRLRSRAASISTSVMSYASDARLSATDEPTWPAPRMTIFKYEAHAKKHAFYAESGGDPNPTSVFLSSCENTQRLEFPVQMRPLEAAALGQARDRPVRLSEVMLEVGPLERLAGLAQRKIEGKLHLGRPPCELRKHALRIADADLLLETGEGE